MKGLLLSKYTEKVFWWPLNLLQKLKTFEKSLFSLMRETTLK